MISPESWDTGKRVVMETAILKQDIAYEAVIDMRFVRTVNAVLP